MLMFPQMQASQGHQRSTSIQQMYHQNGQQVEPYYYSNFQVLNSNTCSSDSKQGAQVSLQNYEQFFTLESAPPAEHVIYDSPAAVSISSCRGTFSPQCSQSYTSDMHHSSDYAYGSPLSGCSGVDDGNDLRHALRELESKLLGPESDMEDSCSCSFDDNASKSSSFSRWNQVLEMIPQMDLKQLLVLCAEAVSEGDIAPAEILMNALEPKVSVSGEPLQRLAAYMLEGIRAKLLSSGSIIYKKLKCGEPTSLELMSSMGLLYNRCPYIKFAYWSTNVIISEAMENESRIHIIDFCIGQGSQWVFLMQSLAKRLGGAPFIRITGVDDSQSEQARGGGLELVGQKLAKVAESCGVPFAFHAAGTSGCEVKRENLFIEHGEAVAVNFAYTLHHMPDESVDSTNNHRDRLLRLVKSLSPKVVTLVEQESNTNTAPFFQRFRETLDYYTAMFESIDAGAARDDKHRISAEEHCVARDIVNLIACEGAERVERHEPFGKWRMRLRMAGFTQCPLSPAVHNTITELLTEYSKNYRLEANDGALFLGWKYRALATCSAWR
ncbi:hypothetical protein Leryth_026975 [Lithospermum erythrorhizon]|uniref:Scarecrow-like protein 13 n=1 Tax=Lithospermum erythrorhizon TaxID=34254 RepID=A0AAV3P4E5_LITER|nr:hypothetical protein Leryth_026975 [Lithospermum erythrorhizon]